MKKRPLWKHTACHSMVAVLLIAPASAEKQTDIKLVSPSGIIFSGKSPTLGGIRLKIQLKGVAQTKAAGMPQWGFWGGTRVDVAMRSVELTVGGNPVEVPSAVYRNLFNITPVTVKFREAGDKLFLYMIGGDGAETYETRIEIVGNTVKERETVGGEFKEPQPPYERIIFKPDGTTSYSLARSIPNHLPRPSGSQIKLTVKSF